MTNRTLILVTLLLICVLIPLQRAIAAVTVSAVGVTSKVTKASDAGDITFIARITSEAGDSHTNVAPVSLAAGGEGAAIDGDVVVGDNPYTLTASPDSFNINGAGTQDVTLTLSREQLTKDDTIYILFQVWGQSKLGSTTFTVTVENPIDMSLEVKEGAIQDLPVGINSLASDISEVYEGLKDVTFTLKIGNNESKNIQVNLTLPTTGLVFRGTWDVNIDTTKVSLSSTSVTIEPDATEEVVLTVPESEFVTPGPLVLGPGQTVPTRGISSLNYGSYFFKVIATPEGGSPEEVDLRINVIKPVVVANLILETLDGSTQTTTTDDTDDITYTLRVTNAGNKYDGVEITISGDIGTATVNPNAFLLFEDSFEDVTLTIPRTALSDARTYNVIVTTTSENDRTVTATVTTKTTVTGDPSTVTDDTSTPTTPTIPIEPTEPDLSSHQVVLSEFMFESGVGETGLPQWIEVYNNSSKEINLRGWKLKWTSLQPTLLDAITTFDQDFRIPAQQARLIVTALDRHSGGGNLSDDAVYQLPPLIPEGIEQEIEVSHLKEIFVNGFSLQLTNSNDFLVDHIGTLSGGKKRWDLPECLIEGDRSSLIRRFDKGVPRSGLLKRAWRRAYDAKLLVTGLYYGSSRDLGTPGYRRGKPLPVELSQFSAKFLKDEVVVSWTTESELNNAGFNLFRSISRTKNFHRINPKLVQGAGTTGQRNTYQFIDKTAKPDVAYYYRLEDVDLSGARGILTTYRLRGVIAPTGKLMTTWGTLKDVR